MFDEQTAELAAKLVMALKAKKLHISSAESCSGGLIAAALTSVSGASEVFELGVVSYSEGIKNRVLAVKESTLERFTVYSQQTASEMLLGVIRLGGADLALAVTGLAGPGGGTAEKPVGLVYIAVGNAEDLQVKEFRFVGNRDAIRQQTLKNALLMALAYVDKM